MRTDSSSNWESAIVLNNLIRTRRVLQSKIIELQNWTQFSYVQKRQRGTHSYLFEEIKRQTLFGKKWVPLNIIAKASSTQSDCRDVKYKFRSSGQIHRILYNENKFHDLLIARELWLMRPGHLGTGCVGLKGYFGLISFVIFLDFLSIMKIEFKRGSYEAK